MTIGKAATDAGLKVLVDFHYSDFWADSNMQGAPKEWENMTLDEKTEALSEFTTESMDVATGDNMNAAIFLMIAGIGIVCLYMARRKYTK